MLYVPDSAVTLRGVDVPADAPQYLEGGNHAA